MPNIESLDVTLCADLSANRLAALTTDFAKDLRTFRGLQVESKRDALPRDGERGVAISIADLVITSITSGFAASLVGVLRSYLSREPSLSFHLKTSDGREISVAMKNIDSPNLPEALARLMPGE